MKKHLLLSFVALAFTTVVFNGCKDDEDTTPPTITLKGPNPDNLEMLTTYTDPGYTANDDQDGDLTSSVIVNSEVDNRLPGDYEIHYELTDNAGNAADVHREVSVNASGNALAKTYNVIDTCGPVGFPQYTVTLTVSPSNANRVIFNRFADYDNNTAVYANVSTDGTIDVPQQDALDIGTDVSDHTFTGIDGYVTTNGFYLEYTDRNNSAIPVSTANCRSRFTRQ
ncbi:MAG: DUF5011 domain-containing protein [Bacteroidota bacterium]